MKTIFILYEGVADLPLENLDNRTPLQVARCPNASRLAKSGQCGLLAPVQEGLDGRAEMILASLCGLDLEKTRELTRGPLEAESLGIKTSEYTYVYRGNLVTIDGGLITDAHVLGLSLEETVSLAEALQQTWSRDNVRVEVSDVGRLSVLIHGEEKHFPPGYSPSLIEGERIESYLPSARENKLVREIVEQAQQVLGSHAINEVRLDLGENPANGLWLWGGGVPCQGTYRLPSSCASAAVLTQSRIVKGFASLHQMKAVHLEAPWGTAVKQSTFKVTDLVQTLQEVDFLFVYVESPFELGQFGTGEDKVRALERLDHYLLGPLLDVLEAYRPYHLMLASDGLVSSDVRHPTSGNVPLVFSGDGVLPDEAMHWDEVSSSYGSLGTVRPHQIWSQLKRVST